MNKIHYLHKKGKVLWQQRSQLLKGQFKKVLKTTAKATVKRIIRQKLYAYIHYLINAHYIVISCFMYIDTGNGGVINNAVKNLFRGLFGICGYFVPVICAGVSAYLIKTKDIKRFWSKVILSFWHLLMSVRL